MKKALLLTLTALLITGTVIAVPLSIFAVGPEIGQVEAGYTAQGTGIASLSQITDPAGSYYLTADIALNIMTVPSFTGILDGNGKTITTTVPLFAQLGGTVKNLTVAGTVDTSAVAGDTGAVANKADGVTIENVLNTASVSGYTSVYDSVYRDDTKRIPGSAGIIGTVSGVSSITNCKNTGAVNGFAAAGIVGTAGYALNGEEKTTQLIIKDCVNDGRITDTGVVLTDAPNPAGRNYDIAGILAWGYDCKSVTVEGCVNNGAVVSATLPVGGIVGQCTYAVGFKDTALRLTISDCKNYGEVDGAHTGGIVNYITTDSTLIEGCENHVAITSNRGNVAGIVPEIGTAGANAEIINCHNTKDIETTGDLYASGILAYANALNTTVDGCTNTANITSAIASVGTGSIIGYSLQSTTVRNCTNTGTVWSKGNAYAGGIVARLGTAFAATDDASSRTFVVENCVNRGQVKSGGNGNSAGILGYSAYAKLTIKNCINYASVGYDVVTSGGAVGSSSGILSGVYEYTEVGENAREFELDIIGCRNEGTIEGTRAAGILSYTGVTAIKDSANKDAVGSNPVNISYCVNKGIINATTSYASGIAAYLKNNIARISNCQNSGSITGNTAVGGIVGYSATLQLFVDHCENSGAVNTADSAPATNAGGIVGAIPSSALYKTLAANGGIMTEVTYCMNTADVTGTVATGGICGSVGLGSRFGLEHFTNCVNTGNVVGGSAGAGTSDSGAGGIVGYGYGSSTNEYPCIENCVTTGNITGKKLASYFIGYIHNANSIFRNNYGCGNLSATNGATYACMYSYGSTSLKSLAQQATGNYVQEGKATHIARNTSDIDNIANAGCSYIPAADFASGKLALDMNNTVGFEAFYQTLGADTEPVANPTHKRVAKYNESIFNLTFSTVQGAEIRLTEGTTGIRFYAKVDKTDFDAIATAAGTAVTEIGTIIAPKAFVDAAGAFTFAALDAYSAANGNKTVYVKAVREFNTFGVSETADGKYTLRGSLVNIKPANYELEYCATAYIKIGDTYYYSDTYTTRSVGDVARAAIADTKLSQQDGYQHELTGTPGVWSPYTAAQQAIIRSFIAVS